MISMLPFRKKSNTPDKARGEISVRAPAELPKGTFWNRNVTIINFSLDVLLLMLFLIQAWMFAVLHVVFPRGAGSEWHIWGATPLDWSEALATTFCIFSVGVVVHVMFHWDWICGVVSTRIIGRKPGKDDGTQTLIGVAVIVALVHLLVIGILITRYAIKGPA